MHRICLKKNNSENNDEIIAEEPNKYNYKKLYNFLQSSMYIFLNTLNIIIKVSGIYLLWIGLHYFSAHLYIKFCVPDTIIGFLMSPFMIATPHCQGLRWIVYNAAGIINNMWLLIGSWIYSIIWIYNNNT